MLTFVEQQNDLLESLHEVHILVAEFLYLQDQCQFGTIGGGKSNEQLSILFQVLQCLISDQFFFFVPFAQTHDR